MLDHSLLLIKVLLLLGIANGVPIIAKKLLGNHLNAPLDGGLRLPDGRFLFGESKTIRGLVLALACAALAAPLLGFEWITGAGLASASMLGDLASSFIKRRLGLAVHSRALWLDQIPESLLPLLVLRETLGLGWLDILLLVAVFLALELLLSRLLYRLHIREQPY
jgi:CDP-2,3-bis-(O-geranylgeranyl)-sn-glycerol synthase